MTWKKGKLRSDSKVYSGTMNGGDQMYKEQYKGFKIAKQKSK